MRSHYLAKLLFNQSTQSKGTIVIRLLFLAGLIGLADTIASSSAYSQQSLAAGQLEARRYTGIINSAQKKYYQKNHHFADSLEQLNTGIPARTKSYTYQVSPSKVPGVDQAAAVAIRTDPLPNKPYLKKISGVTMALPKNKTMFTFITKRCEANLSLAQGGSNSNMFGVVVSVSFDDSASLYCNKGYHDLDPNPDELPTTDQSTL